MAQARIISVSTQLVGLVPDKTTREWPIPLFDWNVLIGRYNRHVRAALVAKGVSAPLARSLAQELTQEAWILLVEKHRSGRLTEIKLPGLATKQAMFLLADHHKKHSRRAQLVLEAGTSEEVPHTRPTMTLATRPGCNSLERQLDARTQLKRIESMLVNSPTSTRDVFRALDGPSPLTPQQAAVQLGLSVQRVRQIHCELRKRVREQLTGTEGTKR